MKNLPLSEYVNLSVIDELCNLFAKKNRIECGIFNADGSCIPGHDYYCGFCEQYIKKSNSGLAGCKACNTNNLRKFFEDDNGTNYKCHAGLVDFTLEIKIEDEIIGYISVGHISTEPILKENIDNLSKKYAINSERLFEAAQDIKVLSKDELKAAVADAHSIANIISTLAAEKRKTLDTSLNEQDNQNEEMVKPDFLANMCQEIRTPMNAINAMAEMAICENNVDVSKTYVRQIKRSGTILFDVINNILDYSNIEAGQFEITSSQYSVFKVIEDVITVVQPRADEKKIGLMIDVNPNIPTELIGDAARIRQVITNIAINALRFTNKGGIKIKICCTPDSEGMTRLHVDVSDTGRGFKEEEVNNFYALLKKPTNGVSEGVGLGLMVSQKIVELMGGEFTIESEYGVGSEISFAVSQKLPENVTTECVKEANKIKALVYFDNPSARYMLVNDIKQLGGKVFDAHNESELFDKLDIVNYVFIEKKLYDGEVANRINKKAGDNFKVAVVADGNDMPGSHNQNICFVRSPLYSFRIIRFFNEEKIYLTDSISSMIDFEAPEARILVVDDNEMNLSVCVGLLKTFNIEADTANNGISALNMINDKVYDLIFMDQMMPEMSGIEVTNNIRKFHPDYDKVPIIAISANSTEQEKGKFLVEGMNGFLAKPIDIKELIKVLKTYLSAEKIKQVSINDKNLDYEDLSETVVEIEVNKEPELIVEEVTEDTADIEEDSKKESVENKADEVEEIVNVDKEISSDNSVSKKTTKFSFMNEELTKSNDELDSSLEFEPGSIFDNANKDEDKNTNTNETVEKTKFDFLTEVKIEQAEKIKEEPAVIIENKTETQEKIQNITEESDATELDEKPEKTSVDIKEEITEEAKEEESEETPKEQSDEDIELPEFEDIDVEAAVKEIGSKTEYMKLLKNFCGNYEIKISNIQNAHKSKDYARYAVEVHTLKSTAKKIGAFDLGNLAGKMEYASKNFDLIILEADHDTLMDMYCNTVEQIKKHLSI